MIRKALFTLRVGNYAPEICALTFPYLKKYAYKTGREFIVIDERRFPDFPPVYEKLQIFERGREFDSSVFIDADALIHPDFFDPLDLLPRNTVFHNGNDFAPNRWRMDDYFLRDQRMIGSCNWMTGAYRECLDLWHPLDISLGEALENIFPIQSEINAEQFDKSHLIDDYTLSRNIARYGLKFKSVMDLQKERGGPGNYAWHQYTIHVGEKPRQIKEMMRQWGMPVLHEQLPELVSA